MSLSRYSAPSGRRGLASSCGEIGAERPRGEAKPCCWPKGAILPNGQEEKTEGHMREARSETYRLYSCEYSAPVACIGRHAVEHDHSGLPPDGTRWYQMQTQEADG